LDTKDAADDLLARYLQPQDAFYVWGNETGLYYYTERRPPTGFVMLFHLTNPPFAKAHSQKALAELEAHLPDLVITRPEYTNLQDHAIWQWIERHYTLLHRENSRDAFLFYRRR